MAVIYLLHNLIKVSARTELIESSMLPWILLCLLLCCRCLQHPGLLPSPGLCLICGFS